jgi:predicted RecA/RadA family phage recombinase
MKNLVMQSGENITVPAPYAMSGGDGCLVGSLFGVASSVAAVAAPVVLSTVGVYRLPKAAGQAATLCGKIYWDNTARNVTAVAAGNTLIGITPKPAASGDAFVDVRLGIVA